MFDDYKLKMLNKKASSLESMPDKVIINLDIHKGDIVGDIGTGGGYFTFEFSKIVGKNGKVYAVDTNQKSLDFIDHKAKEEGINNIKTVLAKDKGLILPEKVDLFFLRNVLHHLPEPVEYFKNIKHFLNNEGKIALIDYNKNGFSFVGMFGHHTSEEDMIDIMAQAGFNIYEKFDFLSNQSYILFKIK
jgi:arsenite methyltransferase